MVKIIILKLRRLREIILGTLQSLILQFLKTDYHFIHVTRKFQEKSIRIKKIIVQ